LSDFTPPEFVNLARLIEEVFLNVGLYLHAPDIFDVVCQVFPNKKADANLVMRVANDSVQLFQNRDKFPNGKPGIGMAFN
jgi:hypothetical protein